MTRTNVPVQKFRSIEEMNRAVTLPGVTHVRAYAASPARYIAAVDDFFGLRAGFFLFPHCVCLRPFQRRKSAVANFPVGNRVEPNDN